MEFRALLDVYPSIVHRPAEDAERRAWVHWKQDLLDRLRVLELREDELQSEPALWITGALDGIVADSDIRTG